MYKQTKASVSICAMLNAGCVPTAGGDGEPALPQSDGGPPGV